MLIQNIDFCEIYLTLRFINSKSYAGWKSPVRSSNPTIPTMPTPIKVSQLLMFKPCELNVNLYFGTCIPCTYICAQLDRTPPILQPTPVLSLVETQLLPCQGLPPRPTHSLASRTLPTHQLIQLGLC